MYLKFWGNCYSGGIIVFSIELITEVTGLYQNEKRINYQSKGIPEIKMWIEEQTEKV
jgi:hypothetical protein